MTDLNDYATRIYEQNKAVGARHLAINVELVEMADCPMVPCETTAKAYSRLVATIMAVAQSFGYDIITAMDEKLVYNQTRQDHKRENRAEPGGKKF